MRGRHWMLATVAVLVGLLVGHNLPADERVRGDIEANEKVCSGTAPRGFAAYPITRMGELRGCLFVDETDPAHYKVARRARL